MSASWSEDRVNTLTKLWLDGLSASQIARRLGEVTRNAVIGKIHRLGLSGRGATSTSPRTPRATKIRLRTATRSVSPPRTPRPDRVAAVPPLEGPGLVHDMGQLGAHACKWPIGDPKAEGFSFCGRPAEGRYCVAHEQVAVRPGTAWRADRDPAVRRALAGSA